MANILIVEDDELNFELANELLTYRGHSVLWAKDGEECANIISTERPDLILMDIGLPMEDGLTLTKRIKADILTRNIPVVAFTAMVMSTDRENAMEAGCDGFIPKPINITSFANTVEKFIKITYKPHNILAIDDNVMNTEIIRETLESINQNVTAAYNGKQALELIEKEKFDLILLDIMMPDMSGYDIIQKIKLNPKAADLPVVFISALDSTDNIVKGFNLGSYEYIVKPYKIAELKARILNILKIKDLQDDLRSEKKILDIIFEFSADGIVLLNSKFELVSCNDIFLRWIGRNQKSVLNKKFCGIINCNNENFIKNNTENNTHFKFELQTEQKRVLGVNCTRVTSQNPDVIKGYVLVLRDITAQMEIESQKETFVATLTHDLKTPVRAQIKALELLQEGTFGNISKPQEEIITEILNSNKYMSSMLDNLLTTYKYENGNVVLHPVEFDINSLITSSYSELKYIAGDKKQTVSFDFKDEKLNITADPIEIKRVVHNLLYNAINYTDEEGKITISSQKTLNESIVSFIDNGRGITKDEIASLFNKFTSSNKKFRKVGTGLGLYLSKQIMERHGGSISVESEEGIGSTFTIKLPI